MRRGPHQYERFAPTTMAEALKRRVAHGPAEVNTAAILLTLSASAIT